MTQQELDELYTKLKIEVKDLEYDDADDEVEMRFEKAVGDAGGRRFVSFWQDHHHESAHVEEDMIQYMAACGFSVLEDPWLKDRPNWECTSWVVFPPKKEMPDV